MPPLTLILDNLRSAQNVGTILRTADAAGVRQVWLCGITPSPALPGDTRPAYVQERNRRLLAKTALGAETTLKLAYAPTTLEAIAALEATHQIVALEQAPGAIDVFRYKLTGPSALVVGHEVDGVAPGVLAHAKTTVEIPMHGAKESLNVAVATGIALYALSFGFELGQPENTPD